MPCHAKSLNFKVISNENKDDDNMVQLMQL